MGDSDDEFDKRRGRDKFRTERPNYAPERRERGGWEDGYDAFFLSVHFVCNHSGFKQFGVLGGE